jgi:hypothetical protein
MPQLRLQRVLKMLRIAYVGDPKWLVEPHLTVVGERHRGGRATVAGRDRMWHTHHSGVQPTRLGEQTAWIPTPHHVSHA